MPKLSSSSNLISFRQPKKQHPARISRRNRELRSCHYSSYGGVKRGVKRRASGPQSLQIPNSWGAKRARSALPNGDPLLPVHHNWRDWVNLGDGPAGLIAERLLGDDVADYVCFRAVCRPWRLCCTDPRAYGVLDRRFHPRHWIMLRTESGGGGGSSFRRGFINISTGRCRYVDLPELRGQEVFGPTVEGLLILLDSAYPYVVRLLNPFTRHAAELPPVIPLLTESYLRRASFINERSFDVSGAGLADGGSTVAVYFKRIQTLAIAKPGDEHWIVVDQGTLLWSALSFAGRFYCATTSAVMVLETGSGSGVADHPPSPPRLAVAAELTRPVSRFMMDTVHLVDNDGKLMLVDRECNGSRDPRKHWVYRVDLDAGKMLPVCGLSGRAVFIGIYMALSVSPSVFPSISADTIYLGFDSMLRSRMDYSPIYLMDNMDMDGTAKPCHQHTSSMPLTRCGPRGVDEYLSWCVTGYRHGSKASEQ